MLARADLDLMIMFHSVKARSSADAAAFGDVVVLALAGDAAEAALKLVGGKALEGKTMIDACNPIGGGQPVNGVLPFFTPQNESLMERLQNAYPGRISSRRSIRSGMGRWSTLSSPAAGRPCSSAAMTPAPRKPSRKSSTSSAGMRRTWARSRRRGPSSRFADFGASPRHWKERPVVPRVQAVAVTGGRPPISATR